MTGNLVDDILSGAYDDARNEESLIDGDLPPLKKLDGLDGLDL